MLKIGNETLLSNTLKFLDNYGIDHVVINVHYLSEKIINYINGIKLNFNFNITVVEEKAGILDTGGGVLNAIQHFSNEKFLVIKGKALFKFRNLMNNEEYELITHADTPQIVESIPGWVHSITNIGEEVMFTMLWANENFDPDHPDTITSEI